MRRALRVPAPKTVWVASRHRSQARQPAAASRRAGSVGRGGISSVASTTVVYPAKPGGTETQEGGAEDATTRSQEGHQACPPVRAHQGCAARAGSLGGQGRGNRGAHREQGTRPLGRVPPAVAYFDERHVFLSPGRQAFRHEPSEGPHPRPAL